MNNLKCSMNKKKESLSKKSEATTEDISVKLTELKDVTDAGKVLDDLKKLGFNTIEYGNYASEDKAYAVLKHPNGMYAELDYTWVQDSSGRDSYSPGEVVAYDYFKDKDEYEEFHGYSPNESKKPEACKGGKDDDKKDGKDVTDAESKKNEDTYDRPVTLYATTRYDDAEEAQKFLDSIGGGEVKVSKERNGDTLYVSIEGADDAIDTFLAVYKDNYDTLEKDCDADVNGWTDPVDLKYYTVQGRKELTGESHKKSEGIGDRIKMGIDYNMFMRMCGSAAYLDDNEDYWDALWEYYSEMGEVEDALQFFDNLFQYTAWCDADELYNEYLDDKFKDESKSKEECIQAAIDDGDLDVYKHESGNYLVIL